MPYVAHHFYTTTSPASQICQALAATNPDDHPECEADVFLRLIEKASAQVIGLDGANRQPIIQSDVQTAADRQGKAGIGEDKRLPESARLRFDPDGAKHKTSVWNRSTSAQSELWPAEVRMDSEA